MKGIYVLVVSVRKDVSVSVGSLGPLGFKQGLYAYAGSAQKNATKRVERHLKKHKPRFWHIDYLLNSDKAKVLKVFFKEGNKLEECRVSRQIAKRGIPIKSFGSSDCRCDSHLFKIEDYEFLREFMHEIIVDPSERRLQW